MSLDNSRFKNNSLFAFVEGKGKFPKHSSFTIYQSEKNQNLERKKSYYKDGKTINLLISILYVCLSSY